MIERLRRLGGANMCRRGSPCLLTRIAAPYVRGARKRQRARRVPALPRRRAAPPTRVDPYVACDADIRNQHRSFEVTKKCYFDVRLHRIGPRVVLDPLQIAQQMAVFSIENHHF